MPTCFDTLLLVLLVTLAVAWLHQRELLFAWLYQRFVFGEHAS